MYLVHKAVAGADKPDLFDAAGLDFEQNAQPGRGELRVAPDRPPLAGLFRPTRAFLGIVPSSALEIERFETTDEAEIGHGVDLVAQPDRSAPGGDGR